MSDNGTIAILRRDGSVDQIYCHTYSDVANCGICLYLYYNNEDIIDSLIKLNAIIRLEPSLTLDPIHYLDVEEINQNVTSKLQCNEDVEYEHYPTIDTFLSERVRGNYNYLYNSIKKKWFLVLDNNEMQDLYLMISSHCKDGLISGEFKDAFIIKKNDEQKTKIYQKLNNKMIDDLESI